MIKLQMVVISMSKMDKVANASAKQLRTFVVNTKVQDKHHLPGLFLEGCTVYPE